MLKKFFRNIFKIYSKDIRKICTNWVSLVVLGGLVLLPSLYAWINIYASWDPYGSTQGIKVAIVNEDKGGNIKDKKINIGADVTESLKENKALGWTFFDTREEGIEEVDKGKMYATIIIPKDFSKKMTTILDAKPVKPELEYYVNQKINAIAPKITDKGASTIQNEITNTFIKTVADNILDITKSVGIEIDDNYPNIKKLETALYDIDEHFPELEKSLDYLVSAAEKGKIIIDQQDEKVIALKNILNQITGFNEKAQDALSQLNVQTENMIPKVKDNLILAETIFTDIATGTKELETTIIDKKPVVIEKIDKTVEKIDDIKVKAAELSDKVVELDQTASEQVSQVKNEIMNSLDYYKGQLQQLKNNLNKPEEALKILEKLEGVTNRLAEQLGKLNTILGGIQEKLDNGRDKQKLISEKLENILATATNPDGTPNENISTQIDEVLKLIQEVQSNKLQNDAISSAINTQLDKLADSLKELNNSTDPARREEIIKNMQSQLPQINAAIDKANTNTNTRVGSIREKLTLLEEGLKQGSDLSHLAQAVIEGVTTEGKEAIGQLITRIGHAQGRLDEVVSGLQMISSQTTNKVVDKTKLISEKLSELQDKLVYLQEHLEDKQIVEETLNNISTLTSNIAGLLDDVVKEMDDEFINHIQGEIGGIASFSKDVNKLLEKFQSDIDKVSAFSKKLNQKGEVLVEDVNSLKEKMPEIGEHLSNIVNRIKKFNNKVDIQEVLKRIMNDNDDKSNFLASPVVLNTHELYPMANYGAGMTPFYTTLCLWVGALLLTALLSTRAKNADFKYTPVEEFFGKYLLFATLAVMQGLIASLGDVVVLGVEMKQPVLFVCLAMFYSLIFTGIVYTLVSLFGNIGKAIGVVFLVLQLAGSGGTFPVQVTPQFFQDINKFLPFTYGISGMREAIAGVVYETLITDLLALGVFFIIFMVFGVLLKKKANAFLKKFAKKLVEAGVIEH